MDPVFRTVVILCLSVLFVSAAAHKLQNRALFLDQLEAYGILPRPLVGPGAFALALIELALAAALLIPFMATTALYGTALILLAYGLAMELTIWRGRGDIDCGCSGTDGATSISHSLVLRNLVLSGAAIGAALAGSASALTRNLSWLDIGLSILASGTFIALYQAANQLMANGPSLKMWRTA